MIFVDGSNLLVELGVVLGAQIRAEQPSVEAISMACQCIVQSLDDAPPPIGPHRPIRKYWFGSLQGDDTVLQSKQQVLRDAGFEGVLFRKVKGGKEKGVDLAVAREMLIHGFNKHYHTAILVAGDEDYLGLVQDLKRMGLVVGGLFFDTPALSPRLRLGFDHFQVLRQPLAVNKVLAEMLTGN